MNSNACDSDIHVDVSVPITALDDSPITVVTLTDGSQIDFIGCSLFLERHISNSLYEHILIPLKSVIACSLKLSMIEKAQVCRICLESLAEDFKLSASWEATQGFGI